MTGKQISEENIAYYKRTNQDTHQIPAQMFF